MPFSKYLAQRGLQSVYNNTTHPAPPSEVWVGLFTAEPNDAGAGTEVSGTGYARVRIYTDGATAPYWTAATDLGDGVHYEVANSAQFEFPEATGSGGFGTVNSFATFNTQAVTTAWASGTAYALGAKRVPTVANGYYYEATTAGTSSTTQPTWPTTEGNTVADGSVTWTTRKERMYDHDRIRDELGVATTQTFNKGSVPRFQVGQLRIRRKYNP